MTAAALRKELKGYIEAIPERELAALRPLLSVLAGEEETPSAEEIAIVRERMENFPKDFVPFKRSTKRERKQ